MGTFKPLALAMMIVGSTLLGSTSLSLGQNGLGVAPNGRLLPPQYNGYGSSYGYSPYNGYYDYAPGYYGYGYSHPYRGYRGQRYWYGYR